MQRLARERHGGGAAEDVVITGTMTGLSYLTDTLGIPPQITPAGNGDQVQWELGSLPAGSRNSFEVYVQVTEAASSSAGLTLTDTLHPALALQHWWADQPGWRESRQTPQRLILAHPNLAGNSCWEV